MVSSCVRDWLLALADPVGPRERRFGRPMRPHELTALGELALRHSVLAAVTTHARQAAAGHGPSRLVRQPADQAEHTLAAWFAKSAERLTVLAGMALRIRAQAAELGAALAAAGAPAMLLKGADFADRLYAPPALRPFTDLDVLVHPSTVEAVEPIMRGLGYEPLAVKMKHDGGYGEQSWTRGRRADRTVEIHWNLVNSPSLRKGLSVTLDDLRAEPAETNGLLRPTAESRLLIAAVHAAASHSFDRLGLLCDIAQAVRGVAGPIDPGLLADDARRTGAGLALAASLSLTERLLNEPACGDLRARLRLPAGAGLWKLCLSPAVVLRAHARRDSIRRQAFRQMLKRRRP